MKKVAVLLANGFEEIEAITPIDLLRRADLFVEVLGISPLDNKIEGSHKISIDCDKNINNCDSNYDCIVIPGGMPGAKNISENSSAMDLIKNIYSNGGLVAAICASPGVVLGKTNILDNREFTCYPSFEDRVENGFFSKNRVVVSDNVITSRGPGTAMEFSLEIIKYLTDNQKEEAISKALLAPKIS